MLPEPHSRAYQDFSTWLTKLQNLCGDPNDPEENLEKSRVILQLQDLQQWFEQNISSLDDQNLEQNIIHRWQSVQTEIKREFRLLSTDIIFLASARQNVTQTKRLQKIKERIVRLGDYSQIMNNIEE